MPAMSPEYSQRVKRPSITFSHFAVTGLVIGSAPAAIHIVLVPFQLPTPLPSHSCIDPGIPAAMHLSQSAWVQPGGNGGAPPGSCAPCAGAAASTASAEFVVLWQPAISAVTASAGTRTENLFERNPAFMQDLL